MRTLQFEILAHETLALVWVNGDLTAGALTRLDSAIASGTDIVFIELGSSDLRMHMPRESACAPI